MSNKKVSFILSSFRRLNIPISKNVYNFIDNITENGWNPPLGDLDEVDQIVLEKYKNFNKFD